MQQYLHNYAVLVDFYLQYNSYLHWIAFRCLPYNCFFLGAQGALPKA